MRACTNAHCHAAQRRDVAQLRARCMCIAAAVESGAARCSGVGEALRAIIMAAVDTPSLSPVSSTSPRRTNERTNARSLAASLARHHYVFRGGQERITRREKDKEKEREREKEIEKKRKNKYYISVYMSCMCMYERSAMECTRAWIPTRPASSLARISFSLISLSLFSFFFFISLNIPPRAPCFAVDTLEKGP